MLDDLSVVIEPKDVDACPIAIARPVLKAMQNDVETIGQHSTEFNTFARVRARHSLEVRNKRILAVSDDGIVLDVRCADVPAHRFGGFALVEHEVVEGRDGSLVGFDVHRRNVLRHATSIFADVRRRQPAAMLCQNRVCAAYGSRAYSARASRRTGTSESAFFQSVKRSP